MIHTELAIPQAPSETPYALQILLDMYRVQFMQMIETMKAPNYKQQVESQILKEKERNQWLMNRAAQLEKQIKVLIDDSVSLLKARMNELGINASSPGDLLAKAKEIVCRHKELQAKASKLQSQVSSLEQDQAKLVSQRKQELVDKYRKIDSNINIEDEDSQELVLREISFTLAQRKKLQNQVSRLETELITLERFEERKQAPVIKSQPQMKSSRKSREYRTRSQDWPDVPDIGKIEEQNPEILAQKILETGRKIEASKMVINTNKANLNSSQSEVKERERDRDRDRNNIHKSQHYSHSQQQNIRQTAKVNMPAPMAVNKRSSSKTVNNVNSPNASNQGRTSEPPRVVNFEDRLKSIITSVLNEDEQFRSKNPPQNKYPVFNNFPDPNKNHTKPGYPPEMYINTPTGSAPVTNNPHHIDHQAHAPPAQPHSQPERHSHVDKKEPIMMHDYKPSSEMYGMSDTIPRPMEIDSKIAVRQEDISIIEPPSSSAPGIGPGSYRNASNTYEHLPGPSPITNKKLCIEQPDYTQVSPAKLALRRHLSQEKLAAQQSIQYQHPDAGLVATRTIGDLMSGEIERTLEISNQSIINAAVDMSDIHGTTTITPRSVVNQNIPPRPERVNIKLLTVDVKEQEGTGNRQLYSPISRPSSTEGGSLEGLAYLHRSKTPTINMAAVNHMNSTGVLNNQNSSRTNVLYPSSNPNTTANGMYKVMNSRMYMKQSNEYTPLPRADIKPYHESYFTDTKPAVSIKMVDMETCKNSFIPEGLAATLHDRVLNTPVIKEEALDLDTRRDCTVYERDRHYPAATADTAKLIPNTAYNNSLVGVTNVKSENEHCKSPTNCLYYPTQKRISPVIQGPIRSRSKMMGSAVGSEGPVPMQPTDVPANRAEVMNGLPPRAGPDNTSPESHSNTSTPLVDEIPERDNHPRPEEGKTDENIISIFAFVFKYTFK